MMDAIYIVLWISVLILIVITIQANRKKYSMDYRSYQNRQQRSSYDGLDFSSDGAGDGCDGGADGGDCGGD